MSDQARSLPADLLRCCVALPWFDRALLELLGFAGDALDALFASPLVRPLAAQRFELQAEARALLVGAAPELGSEQARLRLWQQHQAAMLSRAAETGALRSSPALAARCFELLTGLLNVLNLRRAWGEMPPLLERARAAGFDQAEQIDLLIVYDALAAIRARRFAEGEAVLLVLSASPDVREHTRMLAWNALGASGFQQGRYDQALDCYRRLHELAEAVGDDEYQGLARLNSSIVRNELGDYQSALLLARQSLGFFRALPLRYREAHALYEIGNTALQLGRWDEAHAHLQPALALYQQLEMQQGLAEIFWAEGLLQLVLGNREASEQHYLRCIAIGRSEAHNDPAIVMEALPYLGLLRQSEGRVAEALALYEEALALAPTVQNEHAAVLLRYRAGTALEQLGRPDEAHAAFAAAVDGLERLRSALATDETKLGLLGTTPQIYEALVLLCLERGQTAEAFGYVERARSRAFLDALGQHAEPDAAPPDLEPASLARAQAALDAGTLLLEFYTVGVLLRDERLVNKLPPASAALRRLLVNQPQALLFVVTHDDVAVHRLPLDPNALQPRPGERSPGTRLLPGPLRARLGAALLGPAAPLLAGRHTLYLVPHGPLHSVPFAALTLPDGRPLAHPAHPAVALAPSATVLLRARARRPAAGRGRLLALGFNDPEHAIALAEAEAALVAGAAGGAAAVGAGPKLPALRAAAPTLRWLHIAGHAAFDPADPLATAIVLGPDERLSGRAIMEQLRLNAAEVTLSACTSGLSTVLPGDELLGLPRALLFAGAARVLCTLWDAADGVALLLVDRYYRGRQRGQPAASALRDAQVALRELSRREVVAAYEQIAAALGAPDLLAQLQLPPGERPYADPFFWAPFMLVGSASDQA